MKPYPPAKLRFHEVTLRTPEEARMDEIKALANEIQYRKPDLSVQATVFKGEKKNG